VLFENIMKRTQLLGYKVETLNQSKKKGEQYSLTSVKVARDRFELSSSIS